MKEFLLFILALVLPPGSFVLDLIVDEESTHFVLVWFLKNSLISLTGLSVGLEGEKNFVVHLN